MVINHVALKEISKIIQEVIHNNIQSKKVVFSFKGINKISSLVNLSIGFQNSQYFIIIF